MTDYFALLGQPRRPWLDPEQVKEAFHRETLGAHPDTQTGEDGAAFAELNEAYQVLRNPKRRLQHLLALKGEAPAREAANVPRELAELFPEVARLLREAEMARNKITNAASALTRSTAIARARSLQQDLREMLVKVGALEENARTRLRAADSGDSLELRALYLLFSYLGRWMAELEERELQLTLAFR